MRGRGRSGRDGARPQEQRRQAGGAARGQRSLLAAGALRLHRRPRRRHDARAGLRLQGDAPDGRERLDRRDVRSNRRDLDTRTPLELPRRDARVHVLVVSDHREARSERAPRRQRHLRGQHGLPRRRVRKIDRRGCPVRDRRHVLARGDRSATARTRLVHARRALVDDRPSSLPRLVSPDRPLVVGPVPVGPRPPSRTACSARSDEPDGHALLVVRHRVPGAAPRLVPVHDRTAPAAAACVLRPRLDRPALVPGVLPRRERAVDRGRSSRPAQAAAAAARPRDHGSRHRLPLAMLHALVKAIRFPRVDTCAWDSPTRFTLERTHPVPVRGIPKETT